MRPGFTDEHDDGYRWKTTHGCERWQPDDPPSVLQLSEHVGPQGNLELTDTPTGQLVVG